MIPSFKKYLLEQAKYHNPQTDLKYDYFNGDPSAEEEHTYLRKGSFMHRLVHKFTLDDYTSTGSFGVNKHLATGFKYFNEPADRQIAITIRGLNNFWKGYKVPLRADTHV